MKKVYVGLSGGVDSALAAAQLLQDGYDVTGVFIKIWQPEFIECTWKEDRLAAMKVAVHLGIPFKEVDLSDKYKEEVISRMTRAYKEGRTPNPDVLCNRFIKFGAFKEWALNNGADFISTGHHAQIDKREDGFHLVRGVDSGKDQAYFLCQLRQDDLEHALFPIGNLEKREVRSRAAKLNLPSAGRPDSQGLCFVGDIDMHTFLKEILDTEEGNVIDEKGNVIGSHDGAALFTVGQRHGFTISNRDLSGKIMYVQRIDILKNEIQVGENISFSKRKAIDITETSWTQDRTPEVGKYTAEVRYHQKPQACELKHEKDKVSIVFEEPQLAAPGQFLVLYKGEECLGGGEII